MIRIHYVNVTSGCSMDGCMNFEKNRSWACDPSMFKRQRQLHLHSRFGLVRTGQPRAARAVRETLLVGVGVEN